MCVFFPVCNQQVKSSVGIIYGMSNMESPVVGFITFYHDLQKTHSMSFSFTVNIAKKDLVRHIYNKIFLRIIVQPPNRKGLSF